MPTDPMKPGRKLNELVATHVMGMSRLSFVDRYSDAYDGHVFFSECIEDAWGVVTTIEGLPEKPIVAIQTALMPGRYMCTIYWPLVTRFPYIFGDSAPHAICMSALVAVGYWKDTQEKGFELGA